SKNNKRRVLKKSKRLNKKLHNLYIVYSFYFHKSSSSGDAYFYLYNNTFYPIFFKKARLKKSRNIRAFLKKMYTKRYDSTVPFNEAVYKIHYYKVKKTKQNTVSNAFKRNYLIHNLPIRFNISSLDAFKESLSDYKSSRRIPKKKFIKWFRETGGNKKMFERLKNYYIKYYKLKQKNSFRTK
ncbi:MAG: hypothetical protein ACP5U0_07440, partial [Caldisphaera sp.]